MIHVFCTPIQITQSVYPCHVSTLGQAVSVQSLKILMRDISGFVYGILKADLHITELYIPAVKYGYPGVVFPKNDAQPERCRKQGKFLGTCPVWTIHIEHTHSQKIVAGHDGLANNHVEFALSNSTDTRGYYYYTHDWPHWCDWYKQEGGELGRWTLQRCKRTDKDCVSHQ